MLDDKKKILAHNAMVETHSFVQKMYYVSIFAILGLIVTLCAQKITPTIPLASAGGWLIVLIMSAYTTALKVLAIVGTAFFIGIQIGVMV